MLDKVVVKTCEDLLDDIPSGDPRWTENDKQAGLGSSYSMQIIHQLQDKQKAQNLFYSFLRETDLWNRLSAYTLRDGPIATVRVLGQYLRREMSHHSRFCPLHFYILI